MLFYIIAQITKFVNNYFEILGNLFSPGCGKETDSHVSVSTGVIICEGKGNDVVFYRMKQGVPFGKPCW